MSVLRPLLSRRGRLVLIATALLMVGALIAAPNVSGAKAAVKQYLSKISPTGVSGNTTGQSFTVTITDCGGTPLESPCTASSTIQLGSAQILVPTRFSNVTFGSASSPNGRNWTGSWDGTYVQAWSVTGNDKLNAGEKVNITFTADVSACETGAFEFTTTAWGSTPTHTGETFKPLEQPTVQVNGCGLGSGDSITDPVTGQTETISGDFTGHVNISFGGNTADCSFDDRLTAATGDGTTTYGGQWAQYHLATEVTITPADDFVSGTDPKVSTSEFAQSIFGGDSSWYLICYAVPIDTAHSAPFVTIGGGTATDRTIDGAHYWVGILTSCDEAPAPCVSEQFLTTGSGSPPWSPGANKVHIAIHIPPTDPYKR
jgi:hypothetical protein